MNITYILGNGFDENFGLNTGYKKFYQYYKEQSSDSKEVKSLKEKMYADRELNVECWADLELALGQFTLKAETSVENFDLLLDDVNSKLKEFLLKKNSLFSVDDDSRAKLLTDFRHPDKYLNLAPKEAMKNFKGRFSGVPNISFLTFNYTEVTEKIINAEYDVNGRIGIDKAYFYEPIHIHSKLLNLILGVNDISQVANEAYHQNEIFVSRFIKPKMNDYRQTTAHTRALGVIATTNLFVVFGASLGKSDAIWAKAIGKRLHDHNARMIYFGYSDGAADLSDRTVVALRIKLQKSLQEKLGIDTDKFEVIKDRIIISFNEQGIFDGYSVQDSV